MSRIGNEFLCFEPQEAESTLCYVGRVLADADRVWKRVNLARERDQMEEFYGQFDTFTTLMDELNLVGVTKVDIKTNTVYFPTPYTRTTGKIIAWTLGEKHVRVAYWPGKDTRKVV